MKKLSAFKNLAALVTLVSVSMFGSLAVGAKPTMAQSRYYNTYEIEPANLNGYDNRYDRITAVNTVCRQVDTNGGRLHIRRWPNGPIVGYLYNGDRIRVVSGSSYNGWVRLPSGGYVYSRYLQTCTTRYSGYFGR